MPGTFPEAVTSATTSKIAGSKQLNGEIKERGTVVLENCEVTSAGEGIAFQVDHGKIVQLITTKISAEAKVGIMAGDQGILKGLRAQIAQCGNAAIYTQSRTVVDLISRVPEKNASCAMDMQSGNATLTDCTIPAHPKVRIMVQSGAELVETQSHFASNGQRDIHRASVNGRPFNGQLLRPA
jgi:hypothetical protein